MISTSPLKVFCLWTSSSIPRPTGRIPVCLPLSASLCRSLLGQMSFLFLLVPGPHLCMRSLQLPLWRRWIFIDDDVLISRTILVKWISGVVRRLHLTPGVSLEVTLPDFHLFCDTSAQDWGTLWSLFSFRPLVRARKLYVINQKELLSISDTVRRSVYLKKLGWTYVSNLNLVTQVP